MISKETHENLRFSNAFIKSNSIFNKKLNKITLKHLKYQQKHVIMLISVFQKSISMKEND